MPIHSSIRLIPILALLCAACATTVRPVHTPGPDPLAEAAAALQGGVPDLFFRDEDIAAAATAIAALRRERPDLRDIGPYPQGSLEIALTDSAWRELAARFPDRSDVVRAPTGLPGIDSVNAELGARGIQLSPYSFSQTIRLIFDRPANIPALAARYRGLPEVEYAGRTEYIGVESSLNVRLSADTGGLALWRGSGDCQSGCIYNRTWTFRYDRRTGRITQLTDSGDPTPSAGLDAWLREPDWAAFDRLDEDTRHAYATAMAEDGHTPLSIIRGLAPRRRALPDFYETDTLLAREEVLRDRTIIEQLAMLSDGGDARGRFFDAHGIAVARDPRASPAAIRALTDELTRRDPPPPEFSRLLLHHPVVRGDRDLMLHVIHEVQPLPEVQREGCRLYLAQGHPAWEQMSGLDAGAGAWSSRLPCLDLVPPRPSP